MKKATRWTIVGIAVPLVLVALMVSAGGLHAAPLYLNVPVSDTGSGWTLAEPNTSRNVAVGPDGTIYVVYHGGGGIRVSRSVDRGQSYLPSVPVTATNAEVEIAVDSNGVVYVAWAQGGVPYISRSTDGGASFSAPASTGFGIAASAIHVAVDPPYVYLVSSISNAGAYLLVNNNNGVGSWSRTTTGLGAQAYAGVAVDPNSGDVFVTADNPTLKFAVSTDNGATFGPMIVPGGSIYFSTYAFHFSAAGRFALTSGQSTPAYRIDLDAGTSTPQTYGNNAPARSRSLAADNCGNVVDGWSAGGNVYYAASQNTGSAFAAPVLVRNSTSRLGVAINGQYFNDIVVVYESGGLIYSSVYQGELTPPCAPVDIQVTKTESTDPVNAPGALTYVVTVGNNGPGSATGVVINEALTLPPGVTVNSITPSPGTSWSSPNWTVGNLNTGASASLTVVLDVDSAAPGGTDIIANTASVSALDQVDTNPANDSATHSTSISNPDPIVPGTASGDHWRVVRNGVDLEVWLNGALWRTYIFASLNSMTLNGLGNDDTLEVDYSGGDPVPPAGVIFNGGTQVSGDALFITNGVFGTVAYNYTNANDGNVDLGGGDVVYYTGLEPITNSGTANDVIFNLPGGNNSVTLGDAPAAGQSRLSGADFETTDFANPSNSLTINDAAGSARSFYLNALDGAFNAAVNVNVGNQFDTVVLNAKTGGGPYTCSGGSGDNDQLDVNLSGNYDYYLTAYGTGYINAPTYVGFALFTDVWAGAGTDSLYGPTTGAVNWTLTGSQTGDVAGYLLRFVDMENLVSRTDDRLYYSPGGTTWNITGPGDGDVVSTNFVDFNRLYGHDGAGDTFNLNGGTMAYIDGRGGTDTLNGPTSGTNNWTVTGANQGAITGGVVNNYYGIENLVSRSTDWIENQTGVATTWNVNAPGPGDGDIPTFGLTFDGFERLYGTNTNVDTFNIDGGSVDWVDGRSGADIFNLNGGTVTSLFGGSQTDYIYNNTAGGYTFNVTGSAYEGNIPGIVTNFYDVDWLVGSDGGDDVFNLGNAMSVASGRGGNDDFYLNPGGSVRRLYGGGGDDEFFFAGGTLVVEQEVWGEAGTDSLYNNTAGGYTFNVTAAYDGNITGVVAGFYAIERLHGSDGGDDTLNVGPAGEMDWMYGRGGDDLLWVDYTGGLDRTLNFDGGAHAAGDLIQLTGSADSGTYDPSAADAGTITYVAGSDTQILTFTGVEPIEDDTVAATFAFNDATGVDQIGVVDGPAIGAGSWLSLEINDLGAVPGFELIRLARKTTIDVYGQAGADYIYVDNPTQADSNTALNVHGNTEDDWIFVVNTAVGAVAVHAAGNQDTDQLTIDNTLEATGDIYNVSDAAVSGGSVDLTYAGMEDLYLDVGDGNDRVNVTGSASTEYWFDGMDPTVLPGDHLYVDAQGNPVTWLPWPPDPGLVSIVGMQPINHVNFEILEVDEGPTDLSIDKTGPLTVTAGATFDYTITVFNNGDSDAQPVVTDTLPYGVSYVSASLGTCIEGPVGTVVCTLPDLTIDASYSFTITVEADADACYEGKVNNYVEVGFDGVDSEPSNDTTDWGTIILNNTTVTISKVVSPDPVNAGELIDFTLVVENVGPGCATGVIVVDELGYAGNPAGLVMEDYDASYSTQGIGPLFNYWYTCSSGGACQRAEPMPPGTMDVITLTLRVPAGAQPGDYTNYADVVWDSGSASYNEDYTVVVESDLRAEKQALTTEVAPGGTALFKVTIFNDGPSDAVGVTISDTLPAGFVAGSQVIAPAEAGTTGITIPAGSHAEILVSMVVAEDQVVGTVLTNVAEVVFADDPNSANNTSSDTVTVIDALPDADVEVVDVRLVGGGPVVPGSVYRFEIDVRNNGPADAMGAVVTTVLLDTEYAIDDLGLVGNWSPADGIWIHDGPWAPGAVQTLWVDLLVPSSAHYTALDALGGFFAWVAAANPQGADAGPNWDSVSFDTQAQATLTLDKTLLNDGVAPGGTAFCEIVVCNNGPSDIDGVAVTDTLGTNLEVGTLVLSPDAGNMYVPAGQCVDVMATARVVGTASAGDPFTNTASVDTSGVVQGAGATLAPVVNAPSGTVGGTVGQSLPDADVEVVSKTFVNPPGVPGGGDLIFEVIVRNNGPAEAEGVVLVDTFYDVDYLVNNHAFSAPPGAWRCSSGMTCVRRDPMPVGATEVITFYLRIPPDAYVTLPDPANNRASVVASNPDPAIGNNSLLIDVPIVPEADLAIAKAVIKDEICLGAYGFYEIVVTNGGPSDAQNVQVTDDLPLELIYGGGSPECTHDGSATGGTVVCDIGTLGAGESYDLLIGFNIAATVVDGTVISNTADVASTTADPNAANNTSNVASFTVLQCSLPEADMSIAKTMAPDPVNAGETVRITLTVSNNGPHAAEGVVVQDRIGFAEQVSGFAFSNPTDWSCDRGVTCVRQTPMVSGAVEWIAFDLHVAADRPAGLYDNEACVVADNPDPDVADNNVTFSYDVTTLATLNISKDDLWDPVIVGGLGNDTAVYVLTVQNNGPSFATNVVVTDTLPAGMVFSEPWIVNASYAGAPSSCAGSPCNLGTLPAGETVEIYVTVHVTDPALCDTTVGNTAGVRWDDTLGTHTDTALQDTDLICQGDLDLKKTGPYTATVFDPFTYVITVTNTGPSPIPAGELTLEDEIPAGLTFVGFSNLVGPCGFAGGPPVWTSTGDLPAGGVCVVGIDVTVAESVCPAGVIFNEAQAHDEDNNIDQAGWVTLVDCSTVLSVDKELFLGTPVAGLVVDYLITVTNAGSTMAYDVELTDNIWTPYPTGAQIVDFYIATSNFGYVPAGGECTNNGYCNLPDLPVGGWIRVFASVQIDPDQDTDLTGLPLDQRACAEGDNAGLACDSAFDPIISQVNLDIQKNDLVETVVAGGDPIQYVITISNTGPSDAFNVVVTDTAQPYFSLVGGLVPADQPIDCSAGDSCTIAVLRAGESVEIYASLEASSDAPAGLQVANNACITQVDAAIESVNPALPICESESTEVVVEADLAIDKTGPLTATTPGVFTYTITVYQNGPSDAQNVMVTDTLPYGVSYVGASLGTCVERPVGTVVCALGDVAAEETVVFELYVQADVDVCYQGKVNNYVEVASETYDPDPANNDDDWGTIILNNTTVTIDKLPAGPVNAGETVDFTLVVENIGPGCAAGLTVVDELQNGLILEGFAAPGYSCSAGGVCVRTAPLLAGDPADTIVLTVRVPADLPPGDYDNTATVTWNSGSASDTEPYTVQAEADLGIAKAVIKDEICLGAYGFYEIVVTNDGPSDAQAITVTDVLSDALVYGGGSPECVHDGSAVGGVVTCTLQTLPAGGSYDLMIGFNIAGAVMSGTVIYNEASVTSATFDPVVPNVDGASFRVVECLLPEADMSVAKTMAPDPVVAGNAIRVHIDVTNNGPHFAEGVTVQDLFFFAERVDNFAFSGPGWSCDGGVTCIRQDPMPPNTTEWIEFDLVVGADRAPGLYNNYAFVAADNVDPDVGDNMALYTYEVRAEADLGIAKAVIKDEICLGAYGFYEVVVTNGGPSDAENVQVTDDLSPDLIYGGGSPECVHDGSATGGTVVCDIGTLGAGESYDLLIGFNIADTVVSGTVISNTADVASTTPDPNGANNTSNEASFTAVECLLPPVDMSVVKRVTDPWVAGTWGTVRITVTNEGPHYAEGVTVRDPLYFGAQYVGFSQYAGDGVTPILAWECDAGVSCARSTPMAPNTSEVLVLDVALPADILAVYGSPLAFNDVYVMADNPDPNAQNNWYRDAFAIETAVTLNVEKHALGTEMVAGGEAVLYTIVVHNAGPSDAYDVVIDDIVDPALTLVSLVPGDLPMTCGGGSCTVGVIAAGDSAELYALVEAPSGTPAGTYADSNEACASSTANTYDNTPVCSAAPIEVIAEADLAIDKTGPLTVMAGATFSYTVTVYNNGPSNALAPVATDTLPYGVSFLGASLGSCVEGPVGTVVCTLPDMLPGEVATIVLDVQADPDICYQGKVDNFAGVGSSTPDPDPANNDDDWGTVVLNSTALTIGKVVSPDPVNAGETVDFTLVVENTGPGCATGVIVVDELGYSGNPAGLVMEDYDASYSTQGAGPLDGYWYACSSGGACQRAEPMPSGTMDVITLTLRVPAGTLPSEYTNYVDVVWDSGNAEDMVDYDVVTEADLSVAKSDLSDPVGPTEGFIYEIVVTNDGPSDAWNVTVSDTLGADLTFASASPGCYETAPGSGAIICALGTVPAGDSADVLIAVIAGDVASGTILTNTADVGSATYDPNAANNRAVENTLVQQPVGPSADLSITKSASPTTVNAGELVTYTLVITNGGPSTAYNVQVLEMVPDGATIIEAFADNPDFEYEFCTLAGVCYLGTVHPTTLATVTTVVRVEPDFAGTSLTNLASVSGDQIDYFPINNITSAVVTVTTWAGLDLEKVDLPDPVIAGEVLVYQLRVTNNGPSDAQGVFITDTIPISTTYVGGSAFCLASGQDVTCTIGTLPAGEEALAFIEVRTDEGIADGTYITNTACVNAANGSSDCAQAATLVTQSALNPTDLEIDKGAQPATVIAGERLTYTIAITNNGPAPATSVQVVDYLPNGVDLVSTTPSQGLCQIDLTCDLGDIAIGGTAAVTIVVDVHSDQLAPLTNVARVSASNPDTNIGNNEATVITPVDAETFLVIDKSANPAVVTPGGPLAYGVVVTNEGPSDAHNVVVSDTLPVEIVSAVFSSSQGSCVGGPGFDVSVCDLGIIPAGESATISILALVSSDASTPFTNTAWLSTSTPNLNPDIDDDVVTFIWAVTDLALNKDATATANAGDTITYSLTVLHQGMSNAQNVVVTDTLPVGVTYLSSSPECADMGGGIVVCTRPLLVAGSSRTFTITVVADDDIEPGTSLENVAVVDSDTPDNDLSNNTDAADTSIIGVTDLVLNKTGPDYAIVGEQITYEITVINQGPSVAQDVEIKDTLPAGVTLDGASVVRSGTGPGVCFDAVCQVSNVAVGEVITMSVVATVDDTFTGSVMTNTATLFTDTPDRDPTNDSDYHVTTIPRIFLPVIWRGQVQTGVPDLVVDMSLTPNKDDFGAGEQVTVTVVVTNRGTGAAGAFWVDFYINPYPVPTMANLLWPDTCTLDPCYGIAWHVAGGLAPGESIVLTSTPASFSPEHTIWAGSFISGTTDLYVYVDSWDPRFAHGAIAEMDETNNRTERHGLSVGGMAGTPSSAPTDIHVPPRPLPY